MYQKDQSSLLMHLKFFSMNVYMQPNIRTSNFCSLLYSLRIPCVVTNMQPHSVIWCLCLHSKTKVQVFDGLPHGVGAMQIGKQMHTYDGLWFHGIRHGLVLPMSFSIPLQY